jgi:hypothetical protein
VACRTDNAPVHIDVVGWGKDSHTHLVENGIHTVAINGANRTDEKTKVSGHDRNGQLDFVNTRAMLYWRLREELNPANNNGVMLPPDPQLKAELCAHRWELRSNPMPLLMLILKQLKSLKTLVEYTKWMGIGQFFKTLLLCKVSIY